MNDLLQYILGGTLSIITDYYIWSKFLKKKINFKSPKTYIIFVILTIVILLNYYFVNNSFKAILLTIIFMPSVCFLFDEDINTSIITPIFSQLIFIVSEFVFMVLLIFLKIFDSINIVAALSGTLILNISITLIAIIISNLNFVHRLYNYLKLITSKIKPYVISIFLLSLILITNITYSILYYSNNMFFIFIINCVMCLLYAIFIIKIIIDKYKYLKVSDKYNTTLDSLKEYEDILNKYRIFNHESKNQLLTIRNMTNNKNIKNYIDEILDNKQKDNEKLIHDTAAIPEGGLRGLIYSKLLYMQENKINGELRVDRQVKTVDLLSVDSSLMLDVCRIVGVFVDNAIEAVEPIKDKYVQIYIYMEDSNLNVSVTNNYSGKIDLDNFENRGYTTKGNNRGFGLALVKEILNNNNNLINIKSIKGNTFTQILKIKM